MGFFSLFGRKSDIRRIRKQYFTNDTPPPIMMDTMCTTDCPVRRCHAWFTMSIFDHEHLAYKKMGCITDVRTMCWRGNTYAEVVQDLRAMLDATEALVRAHEENYPEVGIRFAERTMDETVQEVNARWLRRGIIDDKTLHFFLLPLAHVKIDEYLPKTENNVGLDRDRHEFGTFMGLVTPKNRTLKDIKEDTPCIDPTFDEVKELVSRANGFELVIKLAKRLYDECKTYRFAKNVNILGETFEEVKTEALVRHLVD